MSQREATLSVEQETRVRDLNFRLGVRPMTERWRWLLSGILCLGLALRVWGIDYDLPYVFHADEPFTIDAAQRMFKTGDPNPHFFNYPSLSLYLNALAYVPYYLIGRTMGVFHSPADIPGLVVVTMGTVWTPMSSTVLLGRLLNVMAGAGSILLTYLIGWQLTRHQAIALLAAVFLAISPTNVSLSRFITPNAFVVFFSLLAFWLSVYVFRWGTTWHYVLAGIACGLVVSTKLNAGWIVLCLLAGHFLRSGIQGLKDWRIYFAGICAALAFLATTPYAVLDYPAFSEGAGYSVGVYVAGSHPGMEGDSLRWYLSYLWQFEGPIAVFGVFEIVRGLKARKKEILLLAVFPVAYFLFISSIPIRNDRTVMPVTPFLYILGASFLVNLLQWLAARQPARRFPILAGSALAVLCLAFPFYVVVDSSYRLATTVDSRKTAVGWIEENLPRGAHIAVEAYVPFIDQQHFAVKNVGRVIDLPLDWYVAQRIEYIVFSWGMYGRYYANPALYSQQIMQYDDLFRSLDMVKTFTDGGYEIRIYRLAKQ